MTRSLGFAFAIFLMMQAGQVSAQVPSTTDSMRIIEILSGLSLRQIQLDSLNTIQTIAGAARLKEGSTKFGADSASLNRRTNIIEAFGNVHINDADTLFTTSRYLKYLGTERIAYLKGNVKLSNRKSNLTTEDLEYDLKAGVGKYKGGGKVVNGETVLTSLEGTYLADTKEVLFRKNVQLIGPRYKIRGDSLIYNTETEIVTFTGPTNIKSKEGNIYTTSGTYDLKTGNALFTSRTTMKDSSGRSMSGNSIALDEKSNTVQLEGNAFIKDSTRGYTVLGGQIFQNTKNQSFLATRKPVMIIKQDNDSTFIAADTLFSENIRRTRSDTSYITRIDTTIINPVNNDSSDAPTSLKTDTIQTRIDTIRTMEIKETPLDGKDSLVRYFKAFRHTRVFSDSMQAICDSLYYSEQDSTFRLFYNPVVWNKKTQISGDTIFLYMKEKKVDRVNVINNSMVINLSVKDYFNQISGKTINGYFTRGNIDFLRIKGSPAESIYYMQDDDSAYFGMNRAMGALIEMYFAKDDLKKVKYINEPKGILYPIRQIPTDQKFLQGFDWQDKKRPKNRLELFE